MKCCRYNYIIKNRLRTMNNKKTQKKLRTEKIPLSIDLKNFKTTLRGSYYGNGIVTIYLRRIPHGNRR